MPTIPDSHRDLLDAPGVASLSTVGADGTPQVTAVWFLVDGDVVHLSLLSTRQKFKNLLRNPKATLFLIDPTNPYRTIEVRGDVTLEEDTDLALLDRLLVKYGQDRSTFGAPLENRYAVTLTPTHVVANG